MWTTSILKVKWRVFMSLWHAIRPAFGKNEKERVVSEYYKNDQDLIEKDGKEFLIVYTPYGAVAVRGDLKFAASVVQDKTYWEHPQFQKGFAVHDQGYLPDPITGDTFLLRDIDGNVLIISRAEVDACMLWVCIRGAQREYLDDVRSAKAPCSKKEISQGEYEKLQREAAAMFADKGIAACVRYYGVDELGDE